VQSSGKSSVLESVVGKDFLPRGTDIVTKRPLVVTMKQLPPGEREYGVFSHATPKGQGAQFYNFEEIRAEIDAETRRFLARINQQNAGPEIVVHKSPMFLEARRPACVLACTAPPPALRSRSCVGRTPRFPDAAVHRLPACHACCTPLAASPAQHLHAVRTGQVATARAALVQIHSPDVPDLTVVDLPGTTTIPMKNQPASIVDDLMSMALHYIADPNSIILAVTPANADVANSQARARRYSRRSQSATNL
jgi:dynamin 1-like protein